MRRREMLLAPAALAALPAAGYASADEDPIMPIYRKWWAARQEWRRLSYLPGNENFDLPESLAEEARETEAFYQLISMKPGTMQGVAALTHVLWDLIGPGRTDPDEHQEEVNYPSNRLIASIWRGATGRDDFPQG